MVLRLPKATVTALAANAGITVADPPTRKTRIPRPEIARGLDTQCRAVGLPVGQPEFHFHPTRRWRTDRAWPSAKLLVEIDGGAWLSGGGHSHGKGKGFERDRKKDAEALVLGYRVLRVTPTMVKTGEAVHYLARLLGFSLTHGKAVPLSR